MNESALAQISQWLKANPHQSFVIRKIEDDDIDQTEIQVQDIRVGRQGGDEDDYVAQEALLLKGKGIIRDEHGQATLPLDAYEIPMTDQWSVKQLGNQLHIQTDRATYFIEPTQ